MVGTSSSSSPRLRLVAEEEDFASLVARSRLAKRRGAPLNDVGGWLRRVAENVRTEHAELAESWEGTQAELAAHIERLAAPQERPAVLERPDCEHCHGTTWLEDENGDAYRCEHDAARAAVGGQG